MKRLVPVIMAMLMILSASCGKRGMFILHGTVQGDIDSIIVVGLDSRFDRIDTIYCNNGQFKWSFRPDTVTTLILFLPDGRHHPVFAQKDLESVIEIPSDSGLFSVSGGLYNDSYQSFYLESLNDSTLEQTVNRIDSFITKDPFSEVAPYLIYDNMVLKNHAEQQTVKGIINRMSGNMQDAPYITSLKTEFKDALPANVYLTPTLRDSAGYKIQFAQSSGNKNDLLLCVWASWNGIEGLNARKSLGELLNKYSERSLNVADISIDVNAERWKEAISNDTLSWFSYIETNGWQSRIVQSTNVTSIPVYILLNSAKKVMYVTNSFQDIDKELNRSLPKAKTEKPKTTKKTDKKDDKPKKLTLKLE
jgi:hypothetical protein